MPTNVRKQIESTYKAMATKGKYRPAAPSDGMGNIAVPLKDLDLQKEAVEYAKAWCKEEDAQIFDIGCCNHETRPATIFALEAARNLCGASDATALRLLKMAVAGLEAAKVRK